MPRPLLIEALATGGICTRRCASLLAPSTGRDRLLPRASVVAQKVQCSSHRLDFQ